MSHVIELKSHPLVSHNLAILRSKDTDSQRFREAAQRLTTMVLVAATESLNTVEQTVETPMQKTTEMVFAEDVWFIPILRAGLAMVDVGLNLLPDAQTQHVHLVKD